MAHSTPASLKILNDNRNAMLKRTLETAGQYDKEEFEENLKEIEETVSSTTTQLSSSIMTRSNSISEMSQISETKTEDNDTISSLEKRLNAPSSKTHRYRVKLQDQMTLNEMQKNTMKDLKTKADVLNEKSINLKKFKKMSKKMSAENQTNF